MEVIWKDIEELTPYVNNPKEHPPQQIDKIKSSIRKFGFRVPLVVRSDGEIIAGHGRVLAVEQMVGELGDLLDRIEQGTQRYVTLERINEGSVPCIISDDMTETQAQAFRIADNRVAESNWDWDTLSVELQELREDDFDISLTGFDEHELEGLDFMETAGELDDLSSEDIGEDTYIEKLKCPNCGETYVKEDFEEIEVPDEDLDTVEDQD